MVSPCPSAAAAAIPALCGNCRYFVATPLQPNQGECHRFPPTLLMLSVRPGVVQPGTMSPAVKSVGWCGEWASQQKTLDE
jgi:hypothetical protein